MSEVLDFKDGDGDDFTSEVELVIKTASNGYIINFMGGEEDFVEVYTKKQELIKRLDELLWVF